jgi:hypothetical protein
MVPNKPSMISSEDQRALVEAEKFWTNLATNATAPSFSLNVPLQLTLPYKHTWVTAQARLLGMKVGSFLMCELPSHEGTSLGTTGATCQVRYLVHGKVVGFVAQVLKAQFSPEPLLFLSYPTTVKEVVLRKQERVRVNIDALARVPGRTERVNGIVRDLSATGCGFFIPNDPQLPAGTEITLFLRLPGEETLQRVKSTVRSQRALKKGGFIFGLSFAFDAEDQAVKAQLERLVAVRSGIGTGDLNP